MVLTYRISFPFNKKEWTNHEIADFVLPEFWLSKSEYQVFDNYIEGYPSFISWFTTPIRLCVSCILVKPEKEINQLIIKFYLYRMLMLNIPFLMVCFIFLMESFIAGLLVLLMLFALNLIPIFIQIEFGKMDLKKKIKTLTNNG